jgi:hypothetical protein
MAEPQILAKLQAELLTPAALRYITAGLEREVRRATAERFSAAEGLHRQLADEQSKLQNLVAAIEGGSSSPEALLKAMRDREGSIKRLQAALRRSQEKPPKKELPDLSPWVTQQLQNVTELLKTDVVKAKAEFRGLNLHLVFKPVESKPRAHYVVSGQCDLSVLAFFYLRSKESGAGLDRMLEGPVHSRTPVLLRFSMRLPSVEATGRWRERGRGRIRRERR